jgi:hypothetical protein
MTPAKVCRTGPPGYIGSQTMNLATGRLRLLHKQSDAPTTRLYISHPLNFVSFLGGGLYNVKVVN